MNPSLAEARHTPKARFGMTLQDAAAASGFAIADATPWPPVNFAAVGKTPPVVSATPAGELPKASAVVITWAEAEWAAIQHVFLIYDAYGFYTSYNSAAAAWAMLA
jgi:hypothetical protein